MKREVVSREGIGRSRLVGEYGLNSYGATRDGFIADIPEDKDFSITNLASFKNSKLLVVEDNEINLRMLLKILEHSEMDILTAKNGQEAIKLLNSLEPNDIDLVLMDINMPIMDGYQATTIIRQDGRWSSLPIVALSALNLEQEIARMGEVGMDAFLPKPLNLKQLYTVFKMYLKELREDESYEKQDDVVYTKNLKGINLEKAMSNIGDDMEILKDIMKQFISDYKYSDKRIEFYIKIDDTNMLEKTLLDLIGLSGSIGATELYKVTKGMYKNYIFSRFDDITAKLPEFSKDLREVCNSIETFLEM